MAEVIAAFDPEVPVEHDRQRKYPWDQWFDGQIWRLTPGVDFENHSLVIERQIRTRASARKVAVHIQHGPEYAYLNVRATARPEPGVEAKVHDIIEEAVEEAVALVTHEHDGHTQSIGVPDFVGEPVTAPSPAEEPASSNEPAAPVAAPVQEATEVAAPAPELPPLPTAPETVTIEGMAIPVAPLPDPISEAAFQDTTQPEDVPQGDSSFGSDLTPEGDTVAVGTDEPTQDELDTDTADTSKPIEEQTYDEQLASVESVPAPLPAPTAPAPAGPFQAPSMHPPLPHPAPLPQNPFGGLLGQ